jgi:hypothetical protein
VIPTCPTRGVCRAGVTLGCCLHPEFADQVPTSTLFAAEVIETTHPLTTQSFGASDRHGRLLQYQVPAPSLRSADVEDGGVGMGLKQCHVHLRRGTRRRRKEKTRRGCLAFRCEGSGAWRRLMRQVIVHFGHVSCAVEIWCQMYDKARSAAVTAPRSLGLLLSVGSLTEVQKGYSLASYVPAQVRHVWDPSPRAPAPLWPHSRLPCSPYAP